MQGKSSQWMRLRSNFKGDKTVTKSLYKDSII